MEKNEKLVIRDSAYCVPFVTKVDKNEDTTWVKKMSQNLQWNQTIKQKPLKKYKGLRKSPKL